MPVADPRGNGAVQLVVTDLDGTLSDADERIHPASVRAIRELRAGGVAVLVATGRPPGAPAGFPPGPPPRRRRPAWSSTPSPPPGCTRASTWTGPASTWWWTSTPRPTPTTWPGPGPSWPS